MSDPALPPLYARWLDALLAAELPREPQATCADCAMCAKPGHPPPGLRPFVPDTKCCTYVAELPNFLAGRILRDPAIPEGRARLEARIDAAAGVSPLGVYATRDERARFQAVGDVMGGGAEVRCPHFVVEGGTCSIWTQRNAVCSTWFCKHERGAVGHELWVAVRDLLRSVEGSLAVWALLELGVDVRLVARGLGPNAELGAAPQKPSEIPAFWGEWAGRERELYLAAADLVDPLGWDDVLRIGGVGIAARAAIVKAAQARVAEPGVPARLRLGSFQMLGIGSEASLVTTYSAHDPIALPAPLFGVFHYFDGRPTEQALQAMLDERGIALDPLLLRRLIDHRILVPG